METKNKTEDNTDLTDKSFLSELGIDSVNYGAFNGDWIKNEKGDTLENTSPADGEKIARVKTASLEDYETIVKSSQAVFEKWAMYPAPKRGEIVRQIGNALRERKTALAKLMTMEMGKILSEAEGEVQEIIDMADLAVGMSRQLYGSTIQSERAKHKLYEQWHPLGTIGVITSFNFPMAVWGWNAMLALIAGDTVIWKPSSKTPLCAIALYNVVAPILKDWKGVMNLVIGSGETIGNTLIHDERVKLVSATGSCRLGHSVAEATAKKLGRRALLELGGNNAVTVMPSADLDLALKSAFFGAVGTAGQRCTSLRRLILHKDVYDKMVEKLLAAYKQVKIGDPLDKSNTMGPVATETIKNNMMAALEIIKEQGGKILSGGEWLKDYPGNCYVTPCIVEANKEMKIVKDETFAPIMYLFKVSNIEEAIELQNNVEQGLSSALFTQNLKEEELFLSALGSDCGIANINMSTSGAEIGGAFGGEKDTGGGREAGSDAWKMYMRRQTVGINWSDEMPLAQGIKFDI